MRIRSSAIVAAALLLWGALLVPGTANAAVSATPAPVPRIANSGTDGSTEQVRQLTVCNGVMYAVGSFSQVANGTSNTPIARKNAFAFSVSAPYLINSWNPNANGVVDTVACSPDGTILLGGAFTSAGGAANRHLAKVNATTGQSLPFALHPSGRVLHIEVVSGHTFVGGSFPGYLTSVAPTTGAPDGYTTPVISGTYSYPGVTANGTQIYNMTPKSDASAVLLTGVFTSVGGQHHEQVVRLDLTRGPGAAVVSAWEPTELEQHCATSEPFYARDATFAPDGQHIYVATTGYLPFGTSAAGPRTGPCDATISYPATETAFAGHTWVNYAGCDSYYSVAADPVTVFAGGHQRWVNNTFGCDAAGPGAIAQPGLAEFDSASGSYQPGPNRGRGFGADDLLRTPYGLWIGSDNFQGTDTCNGRHGHMGICFLPN
jgi:hypothetical protein